MKPTYKSVLRIISKFFCIFAAVSPQLAFPAKSLSTQSQPSALPPAKPTVVATPLKPEVKAATSFAPMVRKVAPSVVNIYSTLITRERQSSNPFLDDPVFRQFFGERFGRQYQPQERETQGLGAGTIVTSDG